MAGSHTTSNQLSTAVSAMAPWGPGMQPKSPDDFSHCDLGLTALQGMLWCVDGSPSLTSILTMLLTLHKLSLATSTLSKGFLAMAVQEDHTPILAMAGQDHASNALCTGSMETMALCNQLAVAVLSMLKTTDVAVSSKATLASEVQSLAQDMTQAGKKINHLIKKCTQFS